MLWVGSLHVQSRRVGRVYGSRKPRPGAGRCNGSRGSARMHADRSRQGRDPSTSHVIWWGDLSVRVVPQERRRRECRDWGAVGDVSASRQGRRSRRSGGMARRAVRVHPRTSAAPSSSAPRRDAIRGHPRDPRLPLPFQQHDPRPSARSAAAVARRRARPGDIRGDPQCPAEREPGDDPRPYSAADRARRARSATVVASSDSASSSAMA